MTRTVYLWFSAAHSIHCIPFMSFARNRIKCLFFSLSKHPRLFHCEVLHECWKFIRSIWFYIKHGGSLRAIYYGTMSNIGSAIFPRNCIAPHSKLPFMNLVFLAKLLWFPKSHQNSCSSKCRDLINKENWKMECLANSPSFLEVKTPNDLEEALQLPI